MSTYYTYYLGEKIGNRIYPLGPYDREGHLQYILSRSRSFASDLHEEFLPLAKSSMSEELKQKFHISEQDTLCEPKIQYLPLNQLPDTEWILRGYCLETDVENYLQYPGTEWPEEELKANMLSPVTFAAKAKHELQNGLQVQQFDCEGEPMDRHSCKEYTYFCVPDEQGAGYEAMLIRTVAESFEYDHKMNKRDIVVLLTIG